MARKYKEGIRIAWYENFWANILYKDRAGNVLKKDFDAVWLKEQWIPVKWYVKHDTVYDHGHTYEVTTSDAKLQLNTEVGPVEIWLSDYLEKNKLKKIKVRLKPKPQPENAI